MTGCLSKGDSSNEYQVNAPNGATWEVKSDAVDFRVARRHHAP